jgi:hypothetical protein
LASEDADHYACYIYVLSDGISQAFLPFRFVDVIVIRDHDLFTCFRRNVSKDATSRFGFNENIFPVCQSFETFHLVVADLGYILKFVRNATWWFIEVAPLR